MIEFHDVVKNYNRGTANEVSALNKINLQIVQSDFVTIIGSNGSGKSTLLNAITGEIHIDVGRITIQGKNMDGIPQHKRALSIKKVTQNPLHNLASYMTAAENIALGLRGGQKPFFSPLMKKETPFVKDQLRLLEMDLEERLHEQIVTFSNGQIQALAVLIATHAITNNGILLLDEHTGALDPVVSERVLQITQRFVEEKALTCVMVSHNIQTALSFGNRIIMMDKGNIIFDLNADEKKNLSVVEIVERFKATTGRNNMNDKMILS